MKNMFELDDTNLNNILIGSLNKGGFGFILAG